MCFNVKSIESFYAMFLQLGYLIDLELTLLQSGNHDVPISRLKSKLARFADYTGIELCKMVVSVVQISRLFLFCETTWSICDTDISIWLEEWTFVFTHVLKQYTHAINTTAQILHRAWLQLFWSYRFIRKN